MTSWNEISPQANDLLDGLLSAEEEQLLLRRIAGNADLRLRFQELRILKEGLLQLSTERAPDDLADKVLAALQSESAAVPAGGADASGPSRPWLRLVVRYGAVAASLLAVLFIGSLFLDREEALGPASLNDVAQVDRDDFEAKQNAGLRDAAEERSQAPEAASIEERLREEQDKTLDRSWDAKKGAEQADEAPGLAAGRAQEPAQDLEEKAVERDQQAGELDLGEDLRRVAEVLDASAVAPLSDLLASLEQSARMGLLAKEAGDELPDSVRAEAATRSKRERPQEAVSTPEGEAGLKSRAAPAKTAQSAGLATPEFPVLFAARRPPLVAGGAGRLAGESQDPLFAGLDGTALEAAKALPRLPAPLLGPIRELLRHYGDRVRFLELDRAGIEKLQSNARAGRITLRDLTRTDSSGPAGPATGSGAQARRLTSKSNEGKYLLMLVFEE